MSNLFKLSVFTTVAVVIVATGIAEKAVAQNLTFEGVENLNQVGDFYDTAPNDFNIQFSPDAIGLVDSDAGGNGNFSNEPSPNTILTFETSSATLNSSVGLVDSLSFSYVAFNPISLTDPAATINVLDGSGNLLASQPLLTTPTGDGDPTGGDYDFTTGPNPVTIPFSGTAQSVVFDAPLNPRGGFTGFDDISLTPVPEPSSILGFLTFGAFGARVLLKRKRGKCQN